MIEKEAEIDSTNSTAAVFDACRSKSQHNKEGAIRSRNVKTLLVRVSVSWLHARVGSAPQCKILSFLDHLLYSLNLICTFHSFVSSSCITVSIRFAHLISAVEDCEHLEGWGAVPQASVVLASLRPIPYTRHSDLPIVTCISLVGGCGYTDVCNNFTHVIGAHTFRAFTCFQCYTIYIYDQITTETKINMGYIYSMEILTTMVDVLDSIMVNRAIFGRYDILGKWSLTSWFILQKRIIPLRAQTLQIVPIITASVS